MVSIKEEEEEEPNKQNHQQAEQEEEEPQMESESSPLRSPHQSHLPPKPKPPFYSKPQILPPQNPHPHTHENLSQIIAKDRRIHGFSPLRSPSPDNSKPIQPLQLPPQEPTPSNSIQLNPLSPVIFVNRSIREELSVVSKMDSAENGLPPPARPTHPTPPPPPPPTSSAAPTTSGGGRRSGVDVESGGGDRKSRTVSSILWRERREAMLKRAALGFRVCAFVFCLISFSVMAADKTQGWAGDSFDRYKEYRYCLSINVIGFVYAGSQAADLAYNIITGLHSTQSHMRYGIDFFLDQILTYLIISASSAAASRVDDWVSNWGKDDFTVMASASIGMSFLSFVAFAFSSLISGYNLCTRSHT